MDRKPRVGSHCRRRRGRLRRKHARRRTTVFHSYFRVGFERSSDRGASWTWIPLHRATRTATGGSSTRLSRRVVTPSRRPVRASTCRGRMALRWSRLRCPGNPIASAVHMPTSDRIFVGTTDGRVFRITWAGSAWSAATALTRPRTGEHQRPPRRSVQCQPHVGHVHHAEWRTRVPVRRRRRDLA